MALQKMKTVSLTILMGPRTVTNKAVWFCFLAGLTIASRMIPTMAFGKLRFGSR